MLTQQWPPAATSPPPRPRAEHRVRIATATPAGAATMAGAAAGALGLVWVLYERLLPFTGVLGFWLCWYVLFLLLYAAIAGFQWDRREVVHRVTAAAFGTAGALILGIAAAQVLFVLGRGASAVAHLNLFTRSMAFAGPLSPLSVGGVLHAIVGTLEQLGLATVMSVPLGVATAVFLAEVGGKLARPVQTIVAAMTALPGLIAGLFVYALVILSLGMGKSGFAAALALSVTMLPIVARACEVVLRLVPGTLREASFALGSSQWRTVWNVVLPTARPGLAAAVVLGMARAIGETAPVLVVSSVTRQMNADVFSGPQMSLPLYIWNYAHTEAAAPAYVDRGFGAGFILVLAVLLLFASARRIGGPAPEEPPRRRRRAAQREARA